MNLLGLSLRYLQGDGYKTVSLHTIGLQQFFSLGSKLLQLIEWSVDGGGEGGGGQERPTSQTSRVGNRLRCSGAGD